MILKRRHAAIAATTALLCPLDVHGAHHHGHHQHYAFVSTPINNIIDMAEKQHYSIRRSSRLEYSKDLENDVNIWLPTEHNIAAASKSSSNNNAKSSNGWDNFQTSSIDNTEIDHDNYNIIDDWVDAKKRRSRRLQSLEDVNVENSKKLNYKAREQEKVEEWRRSRHEHGQQSASSGTSTQPLIDETVNYSNNIDTNNNNVPQGSRNINRLDLPYNDISQLSAIQSNAPAILLPSGPGTGKSHTLSLRIAYLLQKWVQHWQFRQQASTSSSSMNTAVNNDEQLSFPMGGEQVCSPDSMIILSFTNNDALRLKERALDYLYPTTNDDNDTTTAATMRNQTSKSLWSGTMHAFSLAILTKYTSTSGSAVATPPLRVLPAREMKNRVAASLRSLLDGGSTTTAAGGDASDDGGGGSNSNARTEGWYRELQLRHIQTLNDVGHSRSILFQNIVRCIDLWKEANMPLASADNHLTVKREGSSDDGSDEEGVRSDCVELAVRLGIPKSSALLALDVFPEYQARHAVAGTVDPSDLAGMAYRHLLENPKSLHLLRSKLKHIIIDEYQDMSVSQHALLRLVVRGVVGDEDIVPSHSNHAAKRKKLLPILLDAMDLIGGCKSEEASYSVPSLFCAGDSSQSIYGWRGAAPLLTVDGFRKDFPQGVVAPLDTCYRLPTDILDAANMLLPSKTPRVNSGVVSKTTKSFGVSPAAAAKVASNVSGGSPSNVDQTKGNALLGNELLLSKGMKKLDSTVLIHGLWDDREEAKYIASTIRRRSKERRKALLKALRNLDDNISAAQEKELLDLTDVAVLVRSSKQINLLEEALTKAGIPFTNDGEGPAASLVQRKRSGKEATIPMKPVTIMTMHKAKGEEFDDIYLAGWTEGEFPHPDAMSSNRVHEERRLAYVALTRARQRVVITHSFMSRKLHFGRDGAKRFVTSQVAPSRFLYELVPSKKRMDGLANKNEVLDGDNVGTFWDRSAGIKDYVAGTNIPQWFQESFQKPAGYVSRREDVRPHTTLLENAPLTESKMQSEKVTTPIDLPSEASLVSSQNEVTRISDHSMVGDEDETEMNRSTTDMSADYSSMTVSQLKHILRSKGLKVSGRKAVLIERLESENEIASSAISMNANATASNSPITVEQLDRIIRRKGLKARTKEKVLIERLKSENVPIENSLLGYLSMTIVQIKNILRSNGLKVSGRKAVLIQRVVSSLSTFRRN